MFYKNYSTSDIYILTKSFFESYKGFCNIIDLNDGFFSRSKGSKVADMHFKLLLKPSKSDMKILNGINKRFFQNTTVFHIKYFTRVESLHHYRKEKIYVDNDSLIIFMSFINGKRVLFKYKGISYILPTNRFNKIVTNKGSFNYDRYDEISKKGKIKFKFKDLENGL